MELIRSVVQGVECFWLAILPLPSNIIDKIYAICRNFIWETKRPPIAWNLVCKTKEDGGLGLKNLTAWNKALLAKTLWNIHQKQDSLWIKWINHIYRSYDSVLEWHWHREKSPLIKQILLIRDILIERKGSKDAAIDCLNCWFGGTGGVSQAYDFFVGKVGKWPWKPLLWKSCILPKHRIALWMFSHGKFLTRDRLGICQIKNVCCVKMPMKLLITCFLNASSPLKYEILSGTGLA